jgi:predicted phage-related endonuclease
MKTVHIKQGIPEWHAHRRAHKNASDAPAMMGYGHMTRSALLHEAFTGLEREVSEYVQDNIFAPGHEFEALARPLAEEILGKQLYPVVGVREIEGLKLSASFDGIDMLETVPFEHKRLNAELREAMFEGCAGTDLPLMYQIQMEHQCIVSEAESVLFMASEWKGNQLVEERHCWYESNPELAAAILAGWKQFEVDLANYVPPEVTVKATGRTPESLPALHIELTGEVTVSNLPMYREIAMARFASINRKLETDQDFADAEQTVKWCASLEERLEAAKQHALSQTQSIDQLFSTIGEIIGESKRVRLDLDKLVKAQKESIRNEIMLSRTASLKAHIADLNASIGKPLMPAINADIAGAMKGKRTVETLRDAADTELARAKIEASNIADGIKANLDTLALHNNVSALFPDVQTLVLKQPDDLAATITARISTHEANLAAQKAEAEAKAAREAEVKAAAEAEQARKAAEWEEANEKARLAALENVQTVSDDPREALAQVMGSTPALIQQPATEDEMHAIGRGIRHGQVVDATIPEPEETDAMLKLGEINARIAPLSITADGLAQLGFTRAAMDKSAKLYLESSFPKICDALITVIGKAKYGQAVEA